MRKNPVPANEKVIDQNLMPTMAWALFFNGLFNGDTGSSWTPTITGLTSTGTPTISGIYYQISGALTYFRVTITPATDTSSVAGNTYIDNFPLDMKANGLVGAVSGGSGSVAMIDATAKRIYLPTWTNVTTPVTIVGLVEAQ
jgi:hypothetical protein